MSIAKMFEAGRMAAREDQERSALAKHLQPALGGDKAAQQAIYGVAPMRGMEVEGLALQRRQGASEVARKQLADLSTLAARAPQMAAQVYPKWKAALEATGIATGLPEQYEEGAMEAMRAFAQGDEYTLTPGSARFGADGRLIASQPHAPPKPDFQLYDSADGPVWLPKPGAGPMPAATAAPPSGGAASLMGSSFDDAVSHVLKTEGGYVANDAGAGPTNFGINSRANPDVNVASLTPDGAKQVYRERYWDAIGADQLPPQIRMAAFDAAVNQGPQRALEWVRQSGGDPQKFAALRQGHYNGLVQSNPEKYSQYAQGWQSRNQQTAGVTAIPVQGVRPKPKAASDGAPSGYRYSADGQSLVPIPGGPADPSAPKALPPAQAAKREEARRKEARLLTSATAEFDETIALIDDILKREGDFGGVTGAGALGARIPGTDWADLDNKLETLRARSAFGSLQEMRANSPTGGALGSVTERELGLLQNAEAQLGTRQSPRALKESLQAYRRVIEGSKRRLQEGYGEFYQDTPAPTRAGPVRVQSAADYNALPSGATYIAPDGTQRRKK